VWHQCRLTDSGRYLGQMQRASRDDTSSVTYDIDPSLTDVPIHTSELEQIMSEGFRDILKDPRKFAHLMGRCIATLKSRSETIQQLTRDIGAMRQQSEQVGRASTLNPIDQVRFLSDDQKAQIFGKMEQERLAAMDREAQKSQAVTKAALQSMNRAKYALLSLAEDASLPMAARQRVQEVLASIETIGTGSLTGSPAAGSANTGSNSGWPSQPVPAPAPSPITPAPGNSGWGAAQ
jgi:hypothetical protein